MQRIRYTRLALKVEKKLIILYFLFFWLSALSAQHDESVRVRLLTVNRPVYFFLSVSEGSYSVTSPAISGFDVKKGDVVLFLRYKEKIAVKSLNKKGFMCDSVIITPSENNSAFSVRTGSGGETARTYSGSLTVYHDLSSLVIVNTCKIEDYLPGVVLAESGRGKKKEFYKAQAVIARTYTYKYAGKHSADRYDLCDDTHCQVYFGLNSDPLMRAAVEETRDRVIVTPDSNLIISAFHSNCGGETSPSEFVWLSPQPYLVKVADPFCVRSRNAAWEETISLNKFAAVLKKNGYDGDSGNAELFAFSQPSRVADYKAVSFSLPLKILRDELNLRSSWFSVIASGDSLYLRGKGYGHGAGLCQEGAMVMAAEGSDYEEIIKFYYKGVLITDIDNAKNLSPLKSEAGK